MTLGKQSAGVSEIPRKSISFSYSLLFNTIPPNGPTLQPYLNPSGHSPTANQFPRPEDKNLLNILVLALLNFFQSFVIIDLE